MLRAISHSNESDLVLDVATTSREGGRPAPARGLFSWGFPDISGVKATIHFAKEIGRLHLSKQDTASAQADFNE